MTEQVERVRKWRGGDQDEKWRLEIETDIFDRRGPALVTLWAEHEEPDLPPDRALVVATPAEARQMAAALLAEADNAEANNRRRVREGHMDPSALPEDPHDH